MKRGITRDTTIRSNLVEAKVSQERWDKIFNTPQRDGEIQTPTETTERNKFLTNELGRVQE